MNIPSSNFLKIVSVREMSPTYPVLSATGVNGFSIIFALPKAYHLFIYFLHYLTSESTLNYFSSRLGLKNSCLFHITLP